MNLIRLLIIAAIVWLTLRIFKNWQQQRLDNKSSKKTTQTPLEIKDMVQCEKCQVHLPLQEAFKSNNKFYCCEEHTH